MSHRIQIASTSEIREALARLAYDRNDVRIADSDMTDCDWLVASHRGVFAVAANRVKLALHGWYFGICQHRDQLYVFENCGHRDQGSNKGRIVRLDFTGKQLSAPHVLVTGLHNNCHQVAVFDGVLHVVDTANQAIRRYTLDGDAVDVKRPFAVAPPTDQTGAYMHINAIAKVGNRIGLVLHNGKALPLKNSEIAWLDADWRVEDRRFLPGHSCHDIVEDDTGRLWHSLSRTGDIMRSDGTHIHITDDRMTRGIALTRDAMAIGISTFGPRHMRGALNGRLVILDRNDFRRLRDIDMPAAPTDVIAV